MAIRLLYICHAAFLLVRKENFSQGLKAANVLISVNDETMHFSWTNDSIPGIPAQSYYVVKKYKDGDKINITASADGMKTVSAATIIPKPFRFKVGRFD